MMKKISILLLLLSAALFGSAQFNPVSWKFTAKKISDKVYDVYLTATLENGWHIYSQAQPADAIAIPTKFSFTNNPLLKVDGKVKESGKLQKYKDPTLGTSAHQYAQTVNFVQRVTLKAPVKTNLAGTVEYQVCDDKKCLPPKKLPFKVNLG